MTPDRTKTDLAGPQSSQRPTASGEPEGDARRFALSVIILTYNEETNIGECLAQLDWADDVILVDSHSTDRTIEIARQCRPDVRVFVNEFRDFGQQRNWALNSTAPEHGWVLFLDADERSTPAFAEAVRAAVSEPGECVGYFLCYRNIFLGRWIKHCTLYPSWQLRLLRRGRVRYEKEGHGQREVAEGPLAYLSTPYDHYPFSKGVAEWIARHNVYSTEEVELIDRLRREPIGWSNLLSRDPIRRRRCLKRIMARIGFRATAQFVYTYFIRGGILDGRPGLVFCLLRAAHEMHVTAKLAEARANRPRGTSTKKAEDADDASPS